MLSGCRQPFGQSKRRKSLKKSTRTVPSKKRSSAIAEPDRAHELEEANKIAGHVAHELNNLLTVIQINTEFLLESARDNPESSEELEEIQTASKRASILARQLLASSRLEPFDPAIAEASLKKKAAQKTEAAGIAKAPRIAETILLVEDEAAVRGLAKKVLSQRGYRVLEASDGAIALRIAASHVGEIDLVLTDIEMPNLGGRGMVEELRELSPGMRVLFMSGFQKDELFSGEDSAHVAYLQKPFTSDT
ncbi:MAG TPA: response regulator, partial [Gemmatimonadaceae bacterium]|nr:response regulator [Gemmatimonadaceae bacterium]